MELCHEVTLYLLGEETSMPAVSPGIVALGEAGAMLARRMAVTPKLNERVGVGVFQPGFAKMVEGGDSSLLRVGDDAVDSFLSVDVGFMLEVAGEGIADRLQNKAGYRDDKEQNYESSAAGEGVCRVSQSPAHAVAAGQSGSYPGAGPKEKEEKNGRTG